MLKPYLSQMVERAARDSDPGLYAEFIVDNMPGPIINSWLARPDLLDYLISLDGRVAEHRDWFEELRAEIAAMLTEAQDSANNGGDVPESDSADADIQDS